MSTKLLCKYCGKEIHQVVHALFINTPLSAEIMPSPSADFPFHRACFSMWVYEKLEQLSPGPLHSAKHIQEQSTIADEQKRICSTFSLDQQSLGAMVAIAITLNHYIPAGFFDAQDSLGFDPAGSSQVWVLALSKYPVKTVPASVIELASLRELYMVDAQLETLPEDIGSLTNLETLILDKNHLTNLPESIGNLANLRKLSLKDNNLCYLPAGITKLKKLKELKISGNPPMKFGNDVASWIQELTKSKCKIELF